MTTPTLHTLTLPAPASQAAPTVHWVWEDELQVKLIHSLLYLLGHTRDIDLWKDTNTGALPSLLRLIHAGGPRDHRRTANAVSYAVVHGTGGVDDPYVVRAQLSTSALAHEARMMLDGHLIASKPLFVQNMRAINTRATTDGCINLDELALSQRVAKSREISAAYVLNLLASLLHPDARVTEEVLVALRRYARVAFVTADGRHFADLSPLTACGYTPQTSTDDDRLLAWIDTPIGKLILVDRPRAEDPITPSFSGDLL